jgi:hypothetical protein
MTVASFFRKYNVGCILNYVRLIITREISCIYTVCPRIEFTRGVLIHCILKLTYVF